MAGLTPLFSYTENKMTLGPDSGLITFDKLSRS